MKLIFNRDILTPWTREKKYRWAITTTSLRILLFLHDLFNRDIVFCRLLSSFSCDMPCFHSIYSTCILLYHPYLVTKHDTSEASKTACKHGSKNCSNSYSAVESFTFIILATRNGCNNHSQARPQRRDESIKIEEHESFLITQSNAIIHPWTMMIHFEYTSATLTAVVRSRRLHTLACLTHGRVLD